jgi:hypothetical protein
MYLFNVQLNKNRYTVYAVNNIENKKKFFDELEKIVKLNESSSSSIKICFDYEFNFKQIGLAQVMISIRNISNNIYLFDPKKFSRDENKFIQKSLYLNSFPKILHGSESLDIPYIYNNVLEGNLDFIKFFTSTITDTRFKCELIGNKKCSLYDALYESGSINTKQHNFLEKLYKDNGKVYKIKWDVYRLKLSQFMYAAYDVIFLRRLNRLLNKKLKKLKFNPSLLNEYIRFTLLFRNGYIILDKNLNANINIDKLNPILNIQYIKNPCLTLVKNYLNGPKKINKILEEFGFLLIKGDLSKMK